MMVSIVIKSLFFGSCNKECGTSFEAEKRTNKINLKVDADRDFVRQ